MPAPKTDPEYDALYAAVCANPDEDTPRLVLADWLDEHGDPHRAAYIRAETQLHRLREDDPDAAAVLADVMVTGYPDWASYCDPASLHPTVARMVALDDLSAAHKTKAEARWTAEFGKRKFAALVGFDRGFPAVLLLQDVKRPELLQPPVSLPGYSLMVSASNPTNFDVVLRNWNFENVCSVSLDSLTTQEPIRKLGELPAARYFNSLLLNCTDGDSIILTPVATQPNWSALNGLFVHAHSLAGDLPNEFAAATHLRGLTGLTLYLNGLSGDGFSRLARLGLPRLRQLGIMSSALDAVGVRAFAPIAFPELRSLSLWCNHLSSDGATVLATQARFPRLVSLDVSDGGITDPAALSALISGPCFPNLTRLLAGWNRAGKLDAKILAREGRGPTLRFLTLRYCNLSAKAVRALATAPALAHLLCIDLTAGECGNDGAAAIAESKWDRLTYLSLEQNGITGVGVKALTAWPGLYRLQYLNLAENPIGLSGAKALVAAKAALQNCRKLVVPQRGKHLPKEGRELLRKAFGKRLAL